MLCVFVADFPKCRLASSKALRFSQGQTPPEAIRPTQGKVATCYMMSLIRERLKGEYTHGVPTVYNSILLGVQVFTVKIKSLRWFFEVGPFVYICACVNDSYLQTYSTIMVASEPMGDSSEHPEFCQLNMFFVVCHSLILSLCLETKSTVNRESPQNYSKNIFLSERAWFFWENVSQHKRPCHNSVSCTFFLLRLYLSTKKKLVWTASCLRVCVCVCV